MTLQSGYLVIADIKGYTAFLTQTELLHAEVIMKRLLGTIIKEMQSPFLVAKLEGDAIFAYAPYGSLDKGPNIVELIESIYCEFADDLEKLEQSKVCSCKACRLAHTLDLKFILHFGTYVLTDIAGFQELSGSDVILVHKLLKNTINESTGMEAYAFFSQSCADSIPIGKLKEIMKKHTENYEHLGDVTGYVLDLHPIWELKRENYTG